MFHNFKKSFYFPIASYFRFFACLKLKRWRPRIIVVTGSSGKTTCLYLVESQLGNRAKYSFKANSAFGIPFDILGLRRENLTLVEWPMLFLLAPFKVFSKIPDQKIYIVEADCDRPNEGKFLSELLNPEVTLWLNSTRTHSMNFEKLVKNKSFSSVDEAIAYEFGFYAQKTQKIVFVDAASETIKTQLKRIGCEVRKITPDPNLEKYHLHYLLPKETTLSIKMVLSLTNYLGIVPDLSFSGFTLPPGRSSVFKGIKGTTLVDSTYNANLDSMRVMFETFNEIKAKEKWVVVGDMLEQGQQEKEEHEKLAKIITLYRFKKVILMGPRISQYTFPLLSGDVIRFQGPREVLDYLKGNIKGGETILFKGARFLEGVIENLLLDKSDAKNLVRRESVWEKRRQKFGL